MSHSIYRTKKITNLFTVAFYNLENLFDIHNDPKIRDTDFLPNSEKNWHIKRYEKKIFKLGTTISNIGFARSGKSPVLVGVAEIENRQVLEDLIHSKHLKNKSYDIVHYDSPDERGIDVALLYQKNHFTVLHSESIPVYITEPNGERDYTRDILWVEGMMHNEKMHILVNHWPSRRDDARASEYKRIIAAERNRELITQILEEDPHAKIIIMGDFNDDPSNTSIKKHLMGPELFNPMERLHTRHQGSLSYRDRWNLFDQIIFSHNFHQYKKDTHTFSDAKIFDKDFLRQHKGRYKGTPFRTYVGKKYHGGYSDHFPVFVQLKLNS